jgi:hypothetical protein
MPSKEQPGTRESYVPPEDRPAVGINPDMPLSELRVRDLASILRLGTRKDFWDGKSWQKDDFDGLKWKDKDKDKEKEKDFKEKPEKEIYEGPGNVGDHVFDPRINHIMQSIAGLTQQIGALANQIERLGKERNG